MELDYATLHKAAQDVRQTKSDVDGELRKLGGTVQDLQPAWKGAAAAGFQNLMQRWQDDTNKLLTALNEIGDLLDKAATRHQTTDEEQSSMFSKYDSALG